mmetsp:Transcript_4407/g.14219  ORF Transcript_4407/g.14219 Transcript_4407/m.14219 type:complete len:215 (+) Transcript_4407:76-720(+)
MRRTWPGIFKHLAASAAPDATVAAGTFKQPLQGPVRLRMCTPISPNTRGRRSSRSPGCSSIQDNPDCHADVQGVHGRSHRNLQVHVGHAEDLLRNSARLVAEDEGILLREATRQPPRLHLAIEGRRKDPVTPEQPLQLGHVIRHEELQAAADDRAHRTAHHLGIVEVRGSLQRDKRARLESLHRPENYPDVDGVLNCVQDDDTLASSPGLNAAP